MASNAFLAPLRGESPLWDAWWLYGLAANVIALILFAAVRAVAGSESILPTLVILPVATYWAIAVWQCAYNSEYRFLGLYLRLCVAAGFLGVLFFGVAALSGRWAVAT